MKHTHIIQSSNTLRLVLVLSYNWLQHRCRQVNWYRYIYNTDVIGIPPTGQAFTKPSQVKFWRAFSLLLLNKKIGFSLSSVNLYSKMKNVNFQLFYFFSLFLPFFFCLLTNPFDLEEALPNNFKLFIHSVVCSKLSWINLHNFKLFIHSVVCSKLSWINLHNFKLFIHSVVCSKLSWINLHKYNDHPLQLHPKSLNPQ